MSRFIEVSHAIEPGMETYPGLPVPVAETLWDYDSSRYDGKAEFYIASLHLCGNTGTYVDAPIHRHRGAADLAGLRLESLADLEYVVFDVRDLREVGPSVLRGVDLAGKAALFLTGWSRYWGTPSYFGLNPFLTADACRALVSSGCVFAGIDSVNIDDMADLSRPAHTVLLGAGVPVCEHMTGLDLLVGAGGRLHAVPIAWKGGATFPVRAYVVL
ncbi:MAG: cyclase family protein [Acidobacteria bacterium]|nr:cyclase family protein [Acidobacteriota bacterium]